MKHTPGPWKAHQDPYAKIWLVDMGNEKWRQFYKQQTIFTEGNAKLIAAAPELLEVIQDFLAAKNKDEMHHAMVRMEEAIAKATQGGEK